MNLSSVLLGILRKSLEDLKFPQVSLNIESPPDPEMGDCSCIAALLIGKKLKRPPREIAAEIKANLTLEDTLVKSVEIAGPGYLNFFWRDEAWITLLQSILEAGTDYGGSTLGAGEKRLFEFVSANPTGPMNVVSARAAALGDSMVRLQRKIGFSVDSEYYVNDSGRQIKLLGESVKARAMELSGSSGKEVAIPDGGYHGAYIIDIAKEALSEYSEGTIAAVSDDEIGRWAAGQIVAKQKSTLLEYGIEYNRWFRESELYTGNRHLDALNRLDDAGHIYEKDGAKYLRTTDFGDDEDRVVITSDGRPTYFLPDIAYHLDKSERGYGQAIDLLGPDHHGHGKRMQAAMRLLGLPSNFLKIIIVQQVNLLRGGKQVKMSKRTGEIITMDELLDEVGTDAAKQIFLSRKWSSHLDFDIEVAKDRSEKSPVFYLQYAHARICSIFRKAGKRNKATMADLQELTASEERNLLRKLSSFPDIIVNAALQLAPHRLNTYLGDLATAFHHFYHEQRVISDNESLTRARLALCEAVQLVLREGLRLMGMSAPEKM